MRESAHMQYIVVKCIKIYGKAKLSAIDIKDNFFNKEDAVGVCSGDAK